MTQPQPQAIILTHGPWQVLHCAWHPTEPVVAVGALNTVFVYGHADGKEAARALPMTK